MDSKYVNLFNTTDEFTEFASSDEYVLPNVNLVYNEDKIILKSNERPLISVGDVAYWNGYKVKTNSLNKFEPSMGTPIGVVVIPEGMLPDGRARITCFHNIDDDGNKTLANNCSKWDELHDDTPLTNYDIIVEDDNNNGITTTDISGYMPTDYNTDGPVSYDDNKAYYGKTLTKYIPSPYFGDDRTLNPKYKMIVEGHNNALSDFNGLSNTELLVGMGENYIAANLAWNYKDGLSNLQWYLPSLGEMCIFNARSSFIDSIIRSISADGGVSFAGYYHTSTESGAETFFSVATGYGNIDKINKNYTCGLRPIAML